MTLDCLSSAGKADCRKIVFSVTVRHKSLRDLRKRDRRVLITLADTLYTRPFEINRYVAAETFRFSSRVACIRIGLSVRYRFNKPSRRRLGEVVEP